MKREYLPCEYSPQKVKNFLIEDSGALKRIGYRGLFGLVIEVIKANRACRKHGVKVEINFTLPMPWL